MSPLFFSNDISHNYDSENVNNNNFWTYFLFLKYKFKRWIHTYIFWCSTVVFISCFNVYCKFRYKRTLWKEKNKNFSAMATDMDLKHSTQVQRNQLPYLKMWQPFSQFYFWFNMFSSNLGSLCKRIFRINQNILNVHSNKSRI